MGLIYLYTTPSRCEGFQTLREPTPYPSAGCAGGLEEPKLMTTVGHVVIRFGSTKLPAHPEGGEGVSL